MEAPASEPPAGRAAGRNLPAAIGSGIALATAFVGSLLLDPLVFLGFIAVLEVVALLELDVALRERQLRPATPVVASAGLVMLFGTYVAGPAGQSVGLVVLVVGALAWFLLDPARTAVLDSLGATLLVAVWVPFLVSFLGLLLTRDDGIWLVVGVVAFSATNDIGAFVVGSRFGRRKLAPAISPAKSWEGLAGGIATALAVAAVGVAPFLPGLDLVSALLLAAVVAVASTVGDLAESVVKRDLGIKDLGRIIPGHGGIMDRADAVLFALPAAHLLLLALGR